MHIYCNGREDGFARDGQRPRERVCDVRWCFRNSPESLHHTISEKYIPFGDVFPRTLVLRDPRESSWDFTWDYCRSIRSMMEKGWIVCCVLGELIAQRNSIVSSWCALTLCEFDEFWTFFERLLVNYTGFFQFEFLCILSITSFNPWNFIILSQNCPSLVLSV